VATEQGQKSKATFDKNTLPHKFNIGDKVLISNDFYVGKNPKLAPTCKVQVKSLTLMTLMQK
jgi:hypothetical protein